MSDYTPTTEEVRGRYFWYGDYGDKEPVEIEAEFDRWLNEVKAQVWEQGYAIGWATAWHGLEHPARNPYRQGEEQ